MVPSRNPKIYFIGGVAGVGKSSTMSYLKKLLPAELFDIRDFDERGIPDGGGLEWHNAETKYWLDIAAENASRGISTIVCGFIHPERLRGMHQSDAHPDLRPILLDASPEVLRKRLTGRYTTPESLEEVKRMTNLSLEEWVPDVIGFMPTLRALHESAGDSIVDTDGKSPEQVAREIAEIIRCE